jgi:hypothetical protein
MFSHPLILEMMARERHEMFLEEARKFRLLSRLKASGDLAPSLRTRVLTNVGEFLIFLGLKLKEKYAPAACSAACTSSSSCNNGLYV